MVEGSYSMSLVWLGYNDRVPWWLRHDFAVIESVLSMLASSSHCNEIFTCECY
jgi:hypothetical protein